MKTSVTGFVRRPMVWVSVVLITAIAIWIASASNASESPVPTVEEMVSGEAVSGQALAGALGLQQEATFPKGCYYFSEVTDGTGYCLDAVATSDEHAYVLGMALRGLDISEEQLAMIRATLAEAAEHD
jgi:hypothetical protein